MQEYRKGDRVLTPKGLGTVKEMLDMENDDPPPLVVVELDDTKELVDVSIFEVEPA